MQTGLGFHHLPAPRGHLLTTITGSQSDHAGVEHKRVDCLVISIRILTGDEDFDILRSDCFHHKGGLFAVAAQNADSKVRFLTHAHTVVYTHNSRLHTLTLQVVQNKIGQDLDTSIREFKTSNILDQFQRQLALVFSPLEGYAFGSANFPQWFQQKFPGVYLATMDRQVSTIPIHPVSLMIIIILLCLHHIGGQPSRHLFAQRDGTLCHVRRLQKVYQSSTDECEAVQCTTFEGRIKVGLCRNQSCNEGTWHPLHARASGVPRCHQVQ